MNEINHQDLARHFEVVTKIGKITIFKQVQIKVATAIYSTISENGLVESDNSESHNLVIETVVDHGVAKHDYLLTRSIPVGEDVCVCGSERNSKSSYTL